LHPLNAFPRSAAAELYYQVNGLEPGQEYRTRVELFPAAQADADASLALTFSDEPAVRFLESHRTIGLNNLNPGRYRVRVTVTGGGATVTEEAYLAVVKDE
jgi:hypothetical protein